MKRLLVFFALVGLASTGFAQSLGDIAKKTEEERDKTTASSSTASKVYSDKDLRGAHAAEPTETGKTHENTVAGKADSTTSDKGKSAKNEAYWRARWTPVQRRLDEELAKSTRLKARVSELTSELSDDFGTLNARRAEAERQRLITESDTLDRVISADKAALANIQEEGRRAGALPGWFR
jgi:hypothetical protein